MCLHTLPFPKLSTVQAPALIPDPQSLIPSPLSYPPLTILRLILYCSDAALLQSFRKAALVGTKPSQTCESSWLECEV
jgi:hypothetical protein